MNHEMTPVDVARHYERLGKPMPDSVRSALGIRADWQPTQYPAHEPTQYPTQSPTQTPRRKYGNEPTEYGGRRYDSKHEAARAQELDMLCRAGEHVGWVPQVKFHLPGGVKYVADFVVLLHDGTFRVEDAKSPATRKDKVYRLKRRLMAECLGIAIVEV